MGGAEMRTLELMPLLVQKEVKFDFCTLSSDLGSGMLDDKIRQLGGEVYPCPIKPSILSFSRRFNQLLKSNNYDVVHSHVHYASGYIARLAYKTGINGRIVHFRSVADGKTITLYRRIYHTIVCRWIDKYATDILAVCRGVMNECWSKDWQKDPRCKVIYNGLDLSAFLRTAVDRKGVRDEMGIPLNYKIFINIGRFSNPKAHDVLLKAISKYLKRNSNTSFLLVGDGELLEQMKKMASDLRIIDRVRFIGVRKDIPRLLRASDCFILSSRREGLPGVVLEAIAAGLPVIATDLPGVQEIANSSKLVTMVPTENVDALSSEMLKMSDLLNSSSVLNVEFPKQFSLQHCSEEIFSIYSQYRR